MAINKLFDKNNSVTPINTYVFSITWAIEGVCSLNTLQGQTKSGIWHRIITKSIEDNDGEISVKIGAFRIGTELTIGFGAAAFTDLKMVAIFVTNRDTGETRKFKPENDVTKDINKADEWMDAFSFKTF